MPQRLIMFLVSFAHAMQTLSVARRWRHKRLTLWLIKVLCSIWTTGEIRRLLRCHVAASIGREFLFLFLIVLALANIRSRQRLVRHLLRHHITILMDHVKLGLCKIVSVKIYRLLGLVVLIRIEIHRCLSLWWEKRLQDPVGPSGVHIGSVSGLWLVLLHSV